MKKIILSTIIATFFCGCAEQPVKENSSQAQQMPSRCCPKPCCKEPYKSAPCKKACPCDSSHPCKTN